MTKHHKLDGHAKPIGETWVWLTSMGLCIGLIMVVALLGLILRNGLSVFWPKPVIRVELREDSKSRMRDTAAMGGIVADTRTKVVQSKGSITDQEWHIMVGNKDTYGLSFKFVDLKDATTIEYPADAIVIERMEYGHAVGIPLALSGTNGYRVEYSDPRFIEELRTRLKEVSDRRARIKHIEKDQIGAINHQMAAIRLAEKSEAAAGNPVDHAAVKAKLQKDYEVLAAEASKLRAQQDEYRFHLRLFTGEEHTIPVGSMVYYHFPNRMGFLEKAGFFFHGLWNFVSEEPREANTEGGIFPAIFGTFVMTLLMSIAVTPFGVLAAIYLREYAKQGLFVRIVRISVNNLAGVPSIVFGVFGLGFFVYFLGGSVDKLFFSDALPTPTFGTGGILWAALTLALMTVPVVIVATEEALAAVPRGTREGSLALGASKWQTIYRVVMPAAAPGILTGLVLAMARGAGEVAPLMLVGVVKLAPSLPIDGLSPYVHLDQKFMHLGFHIYDLGFQSPDSDAAKPMVFATTLFLIALVVLLNLGAIIVRERLRKKYAAGAF